MNRPILSIIIANYNYGRYLGLAIESIIHQDVGDAIELIICDGASHDNSVEVIQKYARGLPPKMMREDWININGETGGSRDCLINWWCSEKDSGQSAAFNKGFCKARGAWLTWLNSDEVYARGALQAVLAHIKKHPHAKWITANDCLFDDDTNVIRKINWGPHFQFPVFKKNRAIAAAFGIVNGPELQIGAAIASSSAQQLQGSSDCCSIRDGKRVTAADTCSCDP